MVVEHSPYSGYPVSEESRQTYELLYEASSEVTSGDANVYSLGEGIVAAVNRATNTLGEYIDLTLIDESSTKDPTVPNIVSGRAWKNVFEANASMMDPSRPVYVNPTSVLEGIAKAISATESMSRPQIKKYDYFHKLVLNHPAAEGFDPETAKRLINNLSVK